MILKGTAVLSINRVQISLTHMGTADTNPTDGVPAAPCVNRESASSETCGYVSSVTAVSPSGGDPAACESSAVVQCPPHSRDAVSDMG